MDGIRPLPALTDAQLDRELESALGIEPSPEFLARVRTRIAAEPEVSAWRLVMWGRGLQPVVAMAVAAVVVAVVIPGVMRKMNGSIPTARVARDMIAPVPDRIERLRPANTTRSRGAGLSTPVKAPAARPMEVDAVHTLPLLLSPVMFAEEDRIAFARFVTAVGDGRVPEKVVQAFGEEEMTPLAIAPLVITPLPSLARLERQGESQW